MVMRKSSLSDVTARLMYCLAAVCVALGWMPTVGSDHFGEHQGVWRAAACGRGCARKGGSAAGLAIFQGGAHDLSAAGRHLAGKGDDAEVSPCSSCRSPPTGTAPRHRHRQERLRGGGGGKRWGGDPIDENDYEALLGLEKNPSKYDFGVFGSDEDEELSSSNPLREELNTKKRETKKSGAPPQEPAGKDEPSLDIFDDVPPEKKRPWVQKKVGPYANLPDQDTEMAWRYADQLLHRQGKGYKERHRDRREHGGKSLAVKRKFGKTPHGSRREQQGANKASVDMMQHEFMSAANWLFQDANAGGFYAIDKSDIYGRRWYKTEDGIEFLRRKKNLIEYMSINQTTFEDGLNKGLAPDDLKEAKQLAKELPPIYDKSGRLLDIKKWLPESSSEDDSVGDRFDWGWETMPNGTLRVWGDGVENEKKWKKTPKLFRELRKIPQEAYRRLPDPS